MIDTVVHDVDEVKLRSFLFKRVVEKFQTGGKSRYLPSHMLKYSKKKNNDLTIKIKIPSVIFKKRSLS